MHGAKNIRAVSLNPPGPHHPIIHTLGNESRKEQTQAQDMSGTTLHENEKEQYILAKGGLICTFLYSILCFTWIYAAEAVANCILDLHHQYAQLLSTSSDGLWYPYVKKRISSCPSKAGGSLADWVRQTARPFTSTQYVCTSFQDDMYCCFEHGHSEASRQLARSPTFPRMHYPPSPAIQEFVKFPFL